ncbi:MAG: M20/M25/M40 family metallo-hydrolase, partial [Bacteroidota bacterium]
MTHLEEALKYAHANQERFLAELQEIVAIPSVSTTPEHNQDMRRAAEWVAAQLRALGMANVQILPTGGHPVVYGECLDAGQDRPTVLIYGHYDVQPVDPIELWNGDPFQARQEGDLLFGRGTSDMKGQMVAAIKAIESIIKSGDLPVNVKWLLEGEEEIGSEHLDAFIRANKELLACDFCLNPDAG